MVFQQMVLRKLDINMQKNKIDPYLTSFTKIYFTWIIDLNILSKTIQLLKENIKEKF